MTNDAELPRSYKGMFPFRIGTTSFIYPDHILPNVRRLAPFLDEIELILFESQKPDSLPPPRDIRELAAVGRGSGLGYNVHLPLDIFPGSREKPLRATAVETARRIIDLTAPLAPTTWTIHLPLDPKAAPEAWRKRCAEDLVRIAQDIGCRRLSVETLDYPFSLLADLPERLDLSVCLDIGHLLVARRDPGAFFRKWKKRIPILHLHGVRGRRDHLPLDRLSPGRIRTVARILGEFKGTVSMEVFSFPHLAASLAMLERIEPGGPPKEAPV